MVCMLLTVVDWFVNAQCRIFLSVFVLFASYLQKTPMPSSR